MRPSGHICQRCKRPLGEHGGGKLNCPVGTGDHGNKDVRMFHQYRDNSTFKADDRSGSEDACHCGHERSEHVDNGGCVTCFCGGWIPPTDEVAASHGSLLHVTECGDAGDCPFFVANTGVNSSYCAHPDGYEGAEFESDAFLAMSSWPPPKECQLRVADQLVSLLADAKPAASDSGGAVTS